MSLGAAQTLTPKLDHRPQNQPVLPPVYIQHRNIHTISVYTYNIEIYIQFPYIHTTSKCTYNIHIFSKYTLKDSASGKCAITPSKHMHFITGSIN